jgi:alkyl hydroperoxide reductase subunit AhpF
LKISCQAGFLLTSFHENEKSRVMINLIEQLANCSAALANDKDILKKREFTSFARVRAGGKIGAG